MRSAAFVCGSLFIMACSDGSSVGADADASDADVPATVVARLDWRDVRGEPLDATTREVSERTLVAVHADGVVTVAGCDPELGCDWIWLDGDGDVVKSLDDRREIYGAVVSPRADQVALFAAESIEACGVEPPYTTVATGRYELVDLTRGDVLWQADLRSNVWLDPAFLGAGRWFRVDAVPGEACEGTVPVWRDRAPPHAASAYADPGFYPEAELADGRWVGARRADFGVVDPGDAGSYVALGDGVDGWAAGGGWVHAFDGYGDLTEVVRVVDDAGRRFDLELPEGQAWRGREAWGRWLVACQYTSPEGLASCAVFDVLAEHARRDVRVDTQAATPIGFLGDGRAVWVRSRDDAGGPVLLRVGLPRGDVTVVAEGAGELHPLGDAEAALWVTTEAVLLVEADRVETLLTGPIDQVVTLVGAPGGAPPAIQPGGLRQRALATIVESESVEAHRLHLFDLATRRLVTLTDRLSFAPNRNAPLLADSCGQPWTLRSAGFAADGYRQDPRWFFFVEAAGQGEGEAPLFVVPIDLSAPPRRLGAMHPIYCHPPLASPDGALLVLDVDHYDGLTSHLTFGRP